MATTSQANPEHADLFQLNTSEVETRWRPKFREYKCRTDKFYRSAVPSMVRDLNHQARNTEKQYTKTFLYQRTMTIFQAPSSSPLTLCLSLYFTIKTINIIYRVCCVVYSCLSQLAFLDIGGYGGMGMGIGVWGGSTRLLALILDTRYCSLVQGQVLAPGFDTLARTSVASQQYVHFLIICD